MTPVLSQSCQPGTYNVNFPEETAVSISACVDEKANFGSQSVYWQAKNKSDKEIFLKFTTVISTNCGDVIKSEASAYIGPFELLDAKTISGSNPFLSVISEMNCDGSEQLIKEVSYENLIVESTGTKRQKGMDFIARKSATILSLLFLGLYFLETPEYSIYEDKGIYFALGPQNTVNSIGVYSNIIEKTFSSVQNTIWDPINNTNITYTDRIYNESYKSKKDRIGIPTIGFGIETGYFSDHLNISLPVNVHAGFFDKGQYGFGYSYSGNIFAGSTKYKIGIASDFQYFNMGKSAEEESTFENGYIKTETSSKQVFSLINNKIGFRFQKNMNSKNISEIEPWIFDFYFTLSQVNTNKPNLYFLDRKQTLRPGFEFAFNLYGRIGGFIKYSFINAIGIPQYDLEKGRVPGFFQIGIKRDYAWFKTK
jgi:hypothetical protein